jgi:hypothetical protein
VIDTFSTINFKITYLTDEAVALSDFRPNQRDDFEFVTNFFQSAYLLSSNRYGEGAANTSLLLYK